MTTNDSKNDIKKLEAALAKAEKEAVSKSTKAIQDLAGKSIKKTPIPKKDLPKYLAVMKKEFAEAEKKSLAALLSALKLK